MNGLPQTKQLAARYGMDARIETKARPMYGCHSDFDALKPDAAPDCTAPATHAEKACEGCIRRAHIDGGHDA